jgi:hypothetical protein
VPTTNAKLFYYLRALTAAVLSVAFAAAAAPLADEGSTGFYAVIVSVVFAAYSCLCLLAAGRQTAE